MKTDARVRYTKMRIEEAFLTQLEKKPVNRITVRELCEMAEINRATFYTHYADVYDLLEQLEQKALEEIRMRACEARDRGENLLLGLLYGMIAGNATAALLASENGDPAFHNRTTALLYDLYRPVLAARLPRLTPHEQEEVYRFICGGCAGLMAAWYEEGRITPPEKLSQRIYSMVEKILSSMA